MSQEASEARRLLSVLRERPMSIDPERRESRRSQVVTAMERQVEELYERRGRARRKQRALVTLFAAAAAILVVAVGARRLFAPSTLTSAQSLEIRMVKGLMLHRATGVERTVAVGDILALPLVGELETLGGAAARLETKSGLELEVATGSRVSLAEMSRAANERQVALLQGELSCRVPPLDQGKSFVVATPNARVVVRGTQFSVLVDSTLEGMTRTCVRVSSGRVEVNHANGRAELSAGGHWGCEPLRIGQSAMKRAEESAQGLVEHVPSPRAGAAAKYAPRGTLAEETQLLQAALAAERTGRRDVAAAKLARLLSHYPDSPLSPEAREALERLSPPRQTPP